MKLMETSIRNELDDLRDELASIKSTLESIKKNSRDYIIRYNSDLKIEFASDSLCKTLKIPEEEIIGKGNIEIGIPASSADLWNKTMNNVQKTGRSRRVEFSLPSNGSDHFYEAVIVPEKGKKNNYRKILCIVRDVTIKKKSEHQNKRLLKDLQTQKKELEDLLARDKILLNNLNEGVIISDPHGEFLYMNESSKCFHDIFNETDLKSYSEDQHSMYEFYKNGSRIPFNDLPLQRTLRKETFSDFEIRILNNHTGKTWYSKFSGSPVIDENGNFIFSVLTVRDVTNKKNSESDLNLAQSVAQIGSWRLNIIKNELTWSDEAYRIFNIPIGTPLNYEMFLSFVHPDDRKMVDTSWIAALQGEEYNIDHRIVVDNKTKWVHETAILEFDGEGNLKGGFGTVQDITKQKEAAHQLIMSEQKLKWALQTGKGGVWDWEHPTNNVWLSEELYQVYGIEAGTHVDYNYMLNIMDDRDKERVLKELGDSISNKTDIHCDMRIRHPEKGERWIDFHGRTFYDHSGIAVRSLGIALDVTERKQNEETLKQYAESLNFLSGTATHMIEKLGSTELFRFISDNLYKVAGGAIIILNEFDLLTNRLIVKEFRCTNEEKEKATKIFGREPEGLSFDFPEEIRERIKIGKLDFLEGGIFELAFGQLPQSFCKNLEQELDINNVFAMACSVDRDILGTVAVLSHEKSIMLKNGEVIESVVNQAALALKRKRVEDELRVSEEKFATAFKSSPNGLILSNMEDGTIYEINDTFQEITGRMKEDVIGKSSLDLDIFLNPDDKMNAVNLLREKGSLRNNEISIKHSSGNERIILLSIDIFSVAGRKTMLTTMQDITLQKKAELKISEQANFITAITEAVPDMISIFELPSRKLFYTNREPFNMQGFNSDQIKKMTVEERNELIHPDDRNTLSDYFNKLLAAENRNEIMVEYRARNFENKWMWFRARGRVFERNSNGSIKSCINVVQNITEQKIAEDKLRESEQRLQAVFNNAAIGIVELDDEDRFTLVNNRICEILGYKKEELTGKTVYEITHAEDHSRSIELNKKLHRGELNLFNYEKRYIKNNGTPIWVNITVSALYDMNGKYLKSIGTIENISERKKIEEKLRTQAMILEQVHDAIFAADNANRITYINKAAIKQYEIKDPVKIIGSKLGDCFSLEWMNEEQQHESAISLKKKNVWKGENFYTTSKGKMFWADSVISVTMDESGRRNGWVAIVRDISDRKLMEDQLKKKNDHLTKMNELLEDFVHIAAHDLRAPIASLMMMSDFLTMQETPEEKETSFRQLLPIVKKLQRTVDGLMETVNVQTESDISFKKLMFEDMYNDIMDNCANELNRYRVKIQTDFSEAPDIDYVEAYINSIMKNLITNAIKYSADVESPFIHISTKREKKHVLLLIKDNGIGIDLEKAGENLFKPFKRFTSKAEGTGMGLYIIKNIIEKNGGHIFVESRPNEGTAFYCFLKEYTIDLK